MALDRTEFQANSLPQYAPSQVLEPHQMHVMMVMMMTMVTTTMTAMMIAIMMMQAVVQTFSRSGTYKRPAVWEQPDILRQFQEHVLESTKNAFSLEDTKRRVAHNREYVSFMRKGRTAKQQADATRDESNDLVNLGLHPYRYSFNKAYTFWH